MNRRLAAVAATGVALLLAGCAHVSAPPESWLAWRHQRVEEIGGPKGWASLAGLHWLAPGTHPIGSDPGHAIVLPTGAAPAHVGILKVEPDRVVFTPSEAASVWVDGRPIDAGTPCVLQPDQPGPPTVVQSGRATWWVIARGDRRGIRVRDPGGPGRAAFQGIDVFPYDPRLRVEARLEPFPEPRPVAVPDVAGNVATETAPGVLVFRLHGQEARLMPVEDREAHDWFLNFRDATSGRGTYPGGRFLHVPKAGADGRVVLDFNHAYNPPCAFTAFATCPLPPRTNWLAIPVEAGERYTAPPGGGH
jgi:uncharacterized protein (DUF1684 family)